MDMGDGRWCGLYCRWAGQFLCGQTVFADNNMIKNRVVLFTNRRGNSRPVDNQLNGYIRGLRNHVDKISPGAFEGMSSGGVDDLTCHGIFRSCFGMNIDPDRCSGIIDKLRYLLPA